MKKILSILMCVVMVFAMATITMAEDDKVSMTVSGTDVEIGDEIVLTVAVDGTINDVKSGYVETSFTDNFEYVSAEWLINQNPNFDPSSKDGTIYNMNETFNVSGDVFKLTLKAKNVTNESVSINFQLMNASSANVLNETETVTIKVTMPKISGYSFATISPIVYDGNTKSVEVIKGDNATEDVSINYTYNDDTVLPEDAGTYTVKATITKDNHEPLTLDTTLKIEPKPITITNVKVIDREYTNDADNEATISTTPETEIEGAIPGDDVALNIPAGTFTGLYADGKKGDNKPVIGIKDSETLLTGNHAGNYTLAPEDGLKGNITGAVIKTVAPTIYADPAKAEVSVDTSVYTTLPATVYVNLNASNLSKVVYDERTSTYTFRFATPSFTAANGAALDEIKTVLANCELVIDSVPVTDVATVTKSSELTLGVVEGEGKYIANMLVNINVVPNSKSYKVTKIQVNGAAATNNKSIKVSGGTTHIITATFSRKQAVYPAPGSDKNILEATKSNKIVLTIGSTEATVFGTKKINDVAPIIVNDRTMLPARFVAEALGAKVEWDDAAKKVSIFKDMKKIEIYIGSEVAYINGDAIELDSPALIQNDRTYMPVRFIAESLGANVKWNEVTRQVIITK